MYKGNCIESWWLLFTNVIIRASVLNFDDFYLRMWCVKAKSLNLDDFNLQMWCMKSNHWVFLMTVVDFVALFFYSDLPILYYKFHGYIQTDPM
jgi:hypothetical protein